MKSFLLLTLLAVAIVSCDPGADRINAIDKVIHELRLQLKERKANEIQLKKNLDFVMVEFQTAYDSDFLSADAKAAKLQTIGEKIRLLEMKRQKSEIETIKGKTEIMRLQLEKDQLKKER